MTMHEADEDLLRRLAGLRRSEPDAVRRQRVRTTCHAMLRARREKEERAVNRGRFTTPLLEPVLVGGLSVSYLLAMLFVLLRLRGLL